MTTQYCQLSFTNWSTYSYDRIALTTCTDSCYSGPHFSSLAATHCTTTARQFEREGHQHLSCSRPSLRDSHHLCTSFGIHNPELKGTRWIIQGSNGDFPKLHMWSWRAQDGHQPVRTTPLAHHNTELAKSRHNREVYELLAMTEGHELGLQRNAQLSSNRRRTNRHVANLAGVILGRSASTRWSRLNQSKALCNFRGQDMATEVMAFISIAIEKHFETSVFRFVRSVQVTVLSRLSDPSVFNAQWFVPPE